MRKLFGVLVGAAIGVAVIYGFAELNHRLFQWPAPELGSLAELGRAVTHSPMTAKAEMVGGWFFASMLGGLIGVRAAGWVTAGWIVAVLVAFTGAVSAIYLPQPLWMQVAAVVMPMVAGLVVSGAA